MTPLQKNMNIYPTGTCFDDALELIEMHAKNNMPGWRNMILVHGICADFAKDKFSHAWVEHDGVCLWCGIMDGEKIIATSSIDEYYDYMDVQETTRYTVPQAAAENRRTNTFGPWKKKYLDLCKQPDKPKAEYKLAKHTGTNEIGIWCSKCDMVSYNQDDVKNRYCGNCKKFFT